MPDLTALQLSAEDRRSLQSKQAANFKAVLAAQLQRSYTAFREEADIRDLVTLRADVLDEVMAAAWQHFIPARQEFAALVAVGGYGRGELHPHSDIDLLILLQRADDVPPEFDISGLVTFLWDTGLHIGHSVRSIRQCRNAASEDITIATNLMESRLICGPASLFSKMRKRVGPDKIWPDQAFFKAKWDEQKERHEQFSASEYLLEPNLKSSPGGLRDIQTIGWITKRHFAADDVSALVPGVLTEQEFEQLKEGESFLWRVRFGLHMLSNRCEDRLLFDHQRSLAEIFGYQDDDNGLAVEKLMQSYYRWTSVLNGLNDMLIQLFDDAIIHACSPESIRNINSRFRIRNGYIEANNAQVFSKTPSALIEIFQILARREYIDGIRANTQRLIRQHLHLIDDDFRRDPKIQARFIDMLRSQNKVSRQLRRMNRYGVLGQYIPAFARVVGQMQHDLFHIYTVDWHTLEVIRFMRRFWYEKESKLFPLAAKLVKNLENIELLYIAGLFHDIGKGRGGDHSELGAVDAEEFCQLFNFSKEDTELVVWLVRQHLVMSSVAQRQDLQDPAVIHRFASIVGEQKRLDYLYVLTVADINATNPSLWNSWRASLMRQLYYATRNAIAQGLDRPTDRREHIEAVRQKALRLLESRGISEQQAVQVWGQESDDYFLREKPEDVAWQVQAVVAHGDKPLPLIVIKESIGAAKEGATQIFVFVRDSELLFAVIAAALEQLDLSVQDARIFTSSHGFTLDTFVVLDEFGQRIGDKPLRHEQVRKVLTEQLSSPDKFSETVKKRTPRQMKLFAWPTKVYFSQDEDKQQTLLEVVTPDRPGLLARLGRIFYQFELKLAHAKIATLGERVEDTFYITDAADKPLLDQKIQQALEQEICRQLDEAVSKDDKIIR